MDRNLDTLLMPKHAPEGGLPNKDHGDFWLATGGIFCRSWRIPGYAHMNPDGTLHCNRCGWVTPTPVVTAYSPSTGNTYLTWEELVKAESNGYVVVSVSDRPGTVPAVNGPWDSKAEARKAQSRIRRAARQHEKPHKVKTYVRILWPEERTRKSSRED